MISQQDDQQDSYSKLPEAIRQFYTREEYMWLSDDEKARLVDSETEPEWDE